MSPDIPAYGESPIIAAEVGKLVEAVRTNAAAILTAAVVAQSGRQVTPNEVLRILTDFRFSLWPVPNLGAYKAWKDNFDGTTTQI